MYMHTADAPTTRTRMSPCVRARRRRAWRLQRDAAPQPRVPHHEEVPMIITIISIFYFGCVRHRRRAPGQQLFAMKLSWNYK